ncbi:hypothetical protein C0Z20_22975 [Trinickia symbiotica]|uniref:Uncharacterized protein n=1 Tax=Trinickia symbiotica TaxID=863227 RepID=A0A2N7WYI1_9BURK|nr:hypothetical protein C0Z20_22975 [Trinickia symbiotica]
MSVRKNESRKRGRRRTVARAARFSGVAGVGREGHGGTASAARARWTRQKPGSERTGLQSV